MSLFSVKHALAPLGNKVHLVTILVAAVLFAAFRLSSGGVSIEPKSKEGRISRSTAAPERRPAMPPLEDLVGSEAGAGDAFNPYDELRRLEGEPRPIRRQAAPDRELLDTMMRDDRPAPPRDISPPSNRGSGLDDIEKSLGLR